MKFRNLVLVCGSALLLSSCALLGNGGGGNKSNSNSNSAGIVQFAPEIPVIAESQSAMRDLQLVIDMDYINPALNNSRIAVRPRGAELEVYKNARWAVRPGDMIEMSLMQSFEHAHAFRSVGRPGSGVNPDYRLALDIRHFESDYINGTPPSARVVVFATLVKIGEEKVQAMQTFDVATPSASVDVAQVVDAFSTSISQVNAQIVAWTASQTR